MKMLDSNPTSEEKLFREIVIFAGDGQVSDFCRQLRQEFRHRHYGNRLWNRANIRTLVRMVRYSRTVLRAYREGTIDDTGAMA